MAKNHWQKAAGKPAQKMPGAAPIAPPPLPQTDLTKAAESLSSEAVPQTDLTQVEDSAKKLAVRINDLFSSEEMPELEAVEQIIKENFEPAKTDMEQPEKQSDEVEQISQIADQVEEIQTEFLPVPGDQGGQVLGEVDMNGRQEIKKDDDIVALLTAIASDLSDIKDAMEEGGTIHG